MIRLGIVGCNYGLAVQLPAFRLDFAMPGGGVGRLRPSPHG